MELISAADRSFTYGYSQSQRVERFERIILERNAKELSEKEGLEPKGLDEQPLRVYRSIRVATLYDSNLFYDHNDPKDDLIYLYSPSLGFELGKAGVTRGFLTTYYDMTYANYSENHKLSRLNHAHSVAMGFHAGKFDFRLTNLFQPASAHETGARTELASAGNNQAIAYSDTATAGITYHWTPKVALSGDYQYTVYYFPASSSAGRGIRRFSNQQHGISPRITYQVTPKTSVDFGGVFTTTDYFSNGDKSSKTYGVSAGFGHRLTPKTDIGFQMGYDTQDYNLPIYPSAEGPKFSAILRHEFSPKLVGSISASHQLGEAFDLTEEALEATSFRTAADNYRADLAWEINPRMTLGAYAALQANARDGLYTFADPENPAAVSTSTLEDQIYTSGIRWKWKPRTGWTYFLAYDFLEKFSSFKEESYDDHKVGGSARVIF